MTPQEAIKYLTDNELSPSTIDLLALEALALSEWIEGVAEWIEHDERREIVAEILARYMPKGITGLKETHTSYDSREAYDVSDPKHPDYHDTMSGWADDR